MTKDMKGAWLGVGIVLAIAVIYIISPQSFTGLNVANSGVPTSPTPINAPNPTATVCPNGQPSCQITINLVDKDALNLATSLTDATNLVTTFYKSADGVKFTPVGANTASVFTYDASFNNVVYMGITTDSSHYVAPNAIADKTVNPRILSFDFKDFLGTGTKQWLFKVDMTNLPAPTGGQTTSVVTLTLLGYTSGTDSLSSPADIRSVSTTAGTLSFVDWIDTITADRANAHYEYEVKLNSTNLVLWNAGSSSVSVENIGTVPLNSFTQTQDGTSTYYRYDPAPATQDLKGANYVVTPTNGFTAHHFTVKLSTNLATSKSSGDGLTTTLTIRSLSPSQGGQSVNDAVIICSCP